MSEPKICSKCREQPAGPGGVLCPDCVTVISAALDTYRQRPDDAD